MYNYGEMFWGLYVGSVALLLWALSLAFFTFVSDVVQKSYNRPKRVDVQTTFSRDNDGKWNVTERVVKDD